MILIDNRKTANAFSVDTLAVGSDEATYDSDRRFDGEDYGDDYYDVDNSTSLVPVGSSEFDFRTVNDDVDFRWLADYNISELEPSELFFPSKL
jgi:hypothetical protein